MTHKIINRLEKNVRKVIRQEVAVEKESGMQPLGKEKIYFPIPRKSK